jgi:hypothetical protein
MGLIFPLPNIEYVDSKALLFGNGIATSLDILKKTEQIGGDENDSSS